MIHLVVVDEPAQVPRRAAQNPSAKWTPAGARTALAMPPPTWAPAVPAAPRVGDRLAISIYYDQRGGIFFTVTVTDLTRPATQTVVLYVGRLIYWRPAAWLCHR